MLHFYFQAPNISDWISIVISGSSLIITAIALYYGRKALKEWQNEKRWDILLDAKCNAKLALEFLQYKCSEDRILWDYNNPKYKVEAEIVTNHGSFPILNNRRVEINEHPFTEEKIRTINEKLIVVLKKDKNILLHFYNEVIKKLDDIDRLLKQLELQHDMFESGIVEKKEYEVLAEYYRHIERQITNPDLELLTKQLEEIKKYDID